MSQILEKNREKNDSNSVDSNAYLCNFASFQKYPKFKMLMLSFGLLILIIGGLGALGVWTWFGSLEESVPGVGQMVPQGKVRRIMAPMNGMVVKVYVEENQHVKQGDILAELDPEPADVETKGIKEQLVLLQNEEKVLRSAVYNTKSLKHIAPLLDDVHMAWLSAAQQAYQAQQAEAQMRITQSEHTHKEVIQRLKRIQDVLLTSEQLLAKYKGLYDEGGIPEKDLREYEQRVFEQRGELASLTESVQASKAEWEQAKLKPAELLGSYQRDILARLSENQKQITQLHNDLEKTDLTKKRQYIKAAVDGTINEQVIRGSGDVVLAGQTLFSIVPLTTKMVAEVKVSNRDLTYIHPGQKASLRMEAFPYQHFGRLYGTVEAISPSTQQQQQNTAAQPHAGNPEVSYYVVVIRPEKTQMSYNDVKYPFRSGMTVTADIITREKNILSFFTEPFNLHMEKAFKDPTNR